MSQIDSMQKQWFGLRNTEMGFYTQMTNSNLGKKNNERITREKMILELNMCQSSHCYTHDRYIQCQF